MKNLVYLLFLSLVGFGVAGYFLNWYQFNDAKDSRGHQRLTLDIDGNKVREDLQKGEAKLGDTLQNLNRQNQTGTQGTASSGSTDQKQLTPPQLQPPK